MGAKWLLIEAKPTQSLINIQKGEGKERTRKTERKRESSSYHQTTFLNFILMELN